MSNIDAEPLVRRTPAEIHSLLQAQKESKLNVKDLCQANGLSWALLYHWRNKYLSHQVKEPAFVPLRLSQPDHPVDLFAETEFPGNRVLRLFRDVDPSYLAALLRS